MGDGSGLGVTISYVHNEEWGRGNGLSVLKAREVLTEDGFLILMSDHVLRPEVVSRMLRTRLKQGAALAVDATPGDGKKLEEATKVLVSRRRVRAVGKDLEEFNGVDMGAILCTQDIFQALDSAIASGREELGDALNLLAREGKLLAVEFRHPTWFDIDTQEDMRRARTALLGDLTKPEDGPVSRHLNRPLSTRFSALLVRTPLTPNHMSAITFSVALLAAALLSFGEYIYLVAGGILLQLSSILDGCDGEIARLKFLASPRGGWIDSVMDRYADFVVIAALTYGQWSLSQQLVWWLVALLAILGSYGVSYTAAAYGSTTKRGVPIDRQIPAKRDTRLLIIALSAFLNVPLYGLLVVGILANAEVLRRLIAWR